MAVTVDTGSTTLTREALERSIHQWGGAVSEAALEPGCFFFTHSELPGFIGYRIASSYAIVYGDPICTPEFTIPLAQAFIQYCQGKNLNVLFFVVSESFAKWAYGQLNGWMIQIGEEFTYNPKADVLEGVEANRLRNYIRHAKREGVTVREYVPLDPAIENSFDDLLQKWLKTRKGPQISLGNVNFFDSHVERRWFYLQDINHEMIGTALLSRLDAHDGWLLKYSMILPNAPRGSSELLIATILETLAQEDCNYLTYGLIASGEIKEIIGLNALKHRVIQMSYQMMNWMFRLTDRQVFWKKFRPVKIPRYAVFSRAQLGIAELRAVVKALNIKI